MGSHHYTGCRCPPGLLELYMGVQLAHLHVGCLLRNQICIGVGNDAGLEPHGDLLVHPHFTGHLDRDIQCGEVE